MYAECICMSEIIIQAPDEQEQQQLREALEYHYSGSMYRDDRISYQTGDHKVIFVGINDQQEIRDNFEQYAALDMSVLEFR